LGTIRASPSRRFSVHGGVTKARPGGITASGDVLWRVPAGPRRGDRFCPPHHFFPAEFRPGCAVRRRAGLCRAPGFRRTQVIDADGVVVKIADCRTEQKPRGTVPGPGGPGSSGFFSPQSPLWFDRREEDPHSVPPSSTYMPLVSKGWKKLGVRKESIGMALASCLESGPPRGTRTPSGSPAARRGDSPAGCDGAGSLGSGPCQAGARPGGGGPMLVENPFQGDRAHGCPPVAGPERQGGPG